MKLLASCVVAVMNVGVVEELYKCETSLVRDVDGYPKEAHVT